MKPSRYPPMSELDHAKCLALKGYSSPQFSQLKSPIALASIVGRYRTGKSFLVNRMLLDVVGTGFQVGSRPSLSRTCWYSALCHARKGLSFRKELASTSIATFLECGLHAHSRSVLDLPSVARADTVNSAL